MQRESISIEGKKAKLEGHIEKLMIQGARSDETAKAIIGIINLIAEVEDWTDREVIAGQAARFAFSLSNSSESAFKVFTELTGDTDGPESLLSEAPG
jgi:hypothetical protein